ncbi:hypothetical protein GCM10027399_25530 [Curvibacter fontanus]|jgi:hypothetical protein
MDPEFTDLTSNRSRKGTGVNGRWRNWLIEIKSGSSLRDLRSSALQMGYELLSSRDSLLRGLIVLQDSRISPSKIAQEREMMQRLFRPELMQRVEFLRADSSKNPQEWDLPAELRNADFLAYLDGLAEQDAAAVRGYTSAPGAGRDAVFERLIQTWLQHKPPESTMQIVSAAGVSYPTAAGIIRSLEQQGLIERGPGRAIQLGRFPWSEWRNWLARTSDTRKTVHYVSTTGLPRPYLQMVSRLQDMQRSDVAISGVLGAQQYVPEVNIVGTPRLDLIVAGQPGSFSDSDVRRLDASLEPRSGESRQSHVAVHFIGKRMDPGFEMRDGHQYASPVQCLADFYELGLDGQAQEIIQQLVERRSKITP